jgi:phospholipid/cholesterol/gamma-HCH transport system ATP-binding protein
LYSNRYFKVRYQTDLSKRTPDETYASVAFTLEYVDAISEKLGHTMAQEVIRSLGSDINKHFGAVGGFTSRQVSNS